MKYRRDVDGLRSVAILPVVLYHAGVTALGGGFVGVDVFFVISGYLITSLIVGDLEQGRFSIVSFYERRARRILPALLVMIAATLLVGAFLLLPADFDALSRSAAAALLFYSNVHFWDTASYFDYDSTLKPLLHTWSLAVEEQYYIVFPAFMMLIFRRAMSPLVWLLSVLGLSFGLSLWGVSRYPEATFYLAPTRIWELLIGAVLALGVVPPFKAWLLREGAALAGFAMIVWCVLAFDEGTVFPGLNALWPCLGAALIIHSRTGAVNRFLSLPPLVFIGLISYSLYLWHWPIIVLARYEGYLLGTPAQTAAVLAASTLAAVLSWRFVETPFKTRTVLVDRRPLFQAAGLSIAGCLALALGLNQLRQSEAGVATVAAAEAGRAEARAAYGEGQCFFSSDAPLDSIDPLRCLAPDPARPDYLLIGDSFAAHLWPGLSTALHDARLLQFTFGGCPPLLSSLQRTEPGCKKVARAVFDSIKTHRYDVILVAARWQPGRLPELERTLRHLKPLTNQIVLFGPMVEYRGNLPEILEGSERPERVVLKYRTVPNLEEREMNAMAERLDIRYVSMIDLMCDGGSCLLYDANGDPIQWDNAHLTPKASVQLMERAVAGGSIPLL